METGTVSKRQQLSQTVKTTVLYARLETGRIMWLGMVGGGRAVGRPYMFPHNNFSSVYQIFTNLGHMIPLWKGKNPTYFGVIRSKVKVTVTINRIFDNRSFPHNHFSSVYWIFNKLGHMIPCGRERTLFILGSLGQRSSSPLL